MDRLYFVDSAMLGLHCVKSIGNVPAVFTSLRVSSLHLICTWPAATVPLESVFIIVESPAQRRENWTARTGWLKKNCTTVNFAIGVISAERWSKTVMSSSTLSATLFSISAEICTDMWVRFQMKATVR